MASLLLLSPPKEVSAIRSLTMKGLHADGLSRACYRQPAASTRTSSQTYSVPAPSCCPRPAMLLLLFPGAFALDRRNILQGDYCRILKDYCNSMTGDSCVQTLQKRYFPLVLKDSEGMLPCSSIVIKYIGKMNNPQLEFYKHKRLAELMQNVHKKNA